MRKGRGWGNALGGYKTQKRSSNGQFAGSRVTKSVQRQARRAAGPSHAGTAAAKQAGFVPYVRRGFSSTTVGTNAGINATRKYRVSGGVYFKVENRGRKSQEAQLRALDNKKMHALAEKVSPTPALAPYVHAAGVKFRRDTVDKFVGGEKAIGKKANARLTTDYNSMPTLTLEYNRKRKRQKEPRRKAQWAYNDMVTKNKGFKKTRPGRRVSA